MPRLLSRIYTLIDNSGFPRERGLGRGGKGGGGGGAGLQQANRKHETQEITENPTSTY